MHKPRKRELSILLTAHCLDKIHIFMKFRHHIPYGSEVVAYNNILPRTYNSAVKQLKIKGRFCLFHIVLMRYIFPGSFLKIA